MATATGNSGAQNESASAEEVLFRNLFESAPDAIVVADAQGRIVRVNQQTERLFGYARAELIGQAIERLVPERWCEAHVQRRTQYQDAPQMRPMGAGLELFARHKDGREVPVDIMLSPVETATGPQIIAVVRDITRRKGIEAALATSDARLRAFLDNSAVIAWMKDEAGRHVFLSENYQRRFRVRFEDWQGKTDHELWPAAVADAFRRNDQAVLAADHAIEVVEEAVNSDGSHSWWLNHKFPFRDAAGRRFIGGVGVDITARRQTEEALRASEARLRLFIEHAPVALAMFDREMRYVSVSRRWLTDYGLGDQPVLGRSHYTVFPETPARWQEVHRRGLAGEILRADEDRIERGDGTVQWLRWEVLPWTTGDGAIGGIVIFSEDITARKQAAETFRALAGRLQQAREEERTRLARELHDQLGQSLTGLKMDTAWLWKQLAKPDAASSPKILDRLKTMTGLIEETIHDVRRLSSELRPGVLDDLGLVAALQWEAQVFERRAGVSCQLQASTAAENVPREAATAVFRIFQEILANIARHARATHADARLAVEQGMLVLTVADDGRGITAAAIADHGSLGLLGIRERAQAVGGTVDFRGEPGKGTTVTVKIPQPAGTP